MYQIERYLTAEGKDIFQAWFETLRDRRAKIAVAARLNRVRQGNLGDHKYCSDGVAELRFDFGPGFRIYYALEKNAVVLLLCGGNKSTQQKDIRESIERLKDWKERQDDKQKS